MIVDLCLNVLGMISALFFLGYFMYSILILFLSSPKKYSSDNVIPPPMINASGSIILSRHLLDILC